jgi:hypothetical protein
MTAQELLDTEEIIFPDISELEIENDHPVDNFRAGETHFSIKQ